MLTIDLIESFLDVNTNKPSKKSIMMYVMCYFEALRNTDENSSIQADSEIELRVKINLLKSNMTIQ